MFDWVTSQDLNVWYIVSQIFALICFLFDLIAVQRKKKTELLKMDTAAAFCSFLHYAFLGAWPGMVNKIITTVRNAIATYEAKHNRKSHNLLPIIFIVLYICLGVFTFDSFFSLLPMLAATLYTVVIYTGDVAKIRYVYVVTNLIWLIYNIFVFSIVGIVAHVVLVINGLVAIYRYRKKRRKK